MSSALAPHLADRGVGLDEFVSIFFEKSKWAIVAMLGVFKAGGASVPLEPAIPSDRAATICAQSKARFALTSNFTKGYFKEFISDTLVVNGDTFEQPRVENCPLIPSGPHNIVDIDHRLLGEYKKKVLRLYYYIN